MLNECSRRAMSCISLLQGQNSGKMTESAERQAKLQGNRTYLAAIADSHPQAPVVHSQGHISGSTAECPAIPRGQSHEYKKSL
ncbi:hypothetical protein OROHE_004440 [Orobanche hederae]